VAGFFSFRDLQNLLYIRQHKIELQQLSINLAIAFGTRLCLIANRTYQQEAIAKRCCVSEATLSESAQSARVSERFDQGHRRALVVMATETGKNRTIMALIELFLRANQARTVLFVADRDTLVRQALDDNFKVYLPSQRRRSHPYLQLNRAIADLASQMKNRRSRPSSFIEIDLADRIATSGYITLGDGGEQVYVEEYRQRVEGKVLEVVESHPTIAAIRNGEAVTDLQLVALERTLRQELGGGNVQLSESNIRKAFNLKVNSLLAFLRELLEIETLPDYQEVVRRNFEEFMQERQFNANQIRFLRAVQNVFLKNRRLEVADLYEEPLDRFGEDAVERWFTEEEVDELIEFTEQLAA